MEIYVPMDSAAKVLAADEVAEAIMRESASRGIEAQIILNGSRGMVWLEPLVEIDQGQGRIMRSREDVGRHNALDKLIGAMAKSL